MILGATLLASACATRSPEATYPTAVPAAGIVWRIEEGDVIKTKVYTSADLSTEALVNGNGTAFFPAIGRVAVTGLTLDSLETLLNSKYSTQVIRNAAVQVSMQREITLYGQVRNPGIYASDPSTTILGLVARAGGQTGQNPGNVPQVFLEGSDGRRMQLPREARLGALDLHRRDAVFLNEPSFFARNAGAIAVTSLVVNILTAMLGLLAVSTR